MKWFPKFHLRWCCYTEPEPSKISKKFEEKKESSKDEVEMEPSKPNKPIIPSKHKRDIIPKKVRDATWIKYHGKSLKGVCYCCGKSITRYNRGWHCSHVLADVKGGEEIVDNMRTCCPHCNLSMGAQNLYVYMKQHNMQGPGKENIENYLEKHPEFKNDTRKV
jgi:5-methylcytosine-specific restriction endonuclease McrA